MTAPCWAQNEPRPLDAELLAFAGRADKTLNTRRVRAQLGVFRLELKTALKGLKSPRDRAGAFVKYFFQEQRFQSSDDLGDPENLYIDKVLASRQGYCLSLSLILLSVAEHLDLPVHLVATPQHVFLRWEEKGRVFNIETTLKGAFKTDQFYRGRGIAEKAVAAGIYLKNLGRNEIDAHLWNNDGFVKWCQGDLEGARKSFEAAIGYHSHFPEALVNLGVVAGESGDLARARELFESAAQWLPGNAALHLNMAVVALRERKAEKAAAAFAALKKGGAGSVAARLAQATLRRDDHWQAVQKSILTRTRKLQEAGLLAPGLKGTYFSDATAKGAARQRIDQRIKFEWRWSAPMRGLSASNFAVVWDGFVRIPKKDKYGFFLVFERGVRLTVDGVEVIDFPRGKSDKLAQVILDLEAGLHTIKLEYWARRKPNGLIFEVKPALGRKPLPADCLWHQR